MKIGDKVVCVDDQWSLYFPYEYQGELPKKNKLYVIDKFILIENDIGIQLIGSKAFALNKEVGFSITHFRKLEDVKNENELKTLKEQLINK